MKVTKYLFGKCNNRNFREEMVRPNKSIGYSETVPKRAMNSGLDLIRGGQRKRKQFM
jgi:hypothetical protein